MSHLIPNTFSSYQLTKEEDTSGRILNLQQKQVLQNHMAAVAMDKLNLVYDPNNHQDFIMQTAYKQGQLDLLAYILSESEETEKLAVSHN